MVRDMPRLTKASPPADRTRSTTPSISVSPASAVITTTISSASSHKENPGPSGPGFPLGRFCQCSTWQATVRDPDR